MRTFEYRDSTTHKFWNIERSGKSFTVTFGRAGSAGQTQVKTFPDESKARKEHDKLVGEKVRKGYRETTGAATKAPDSLRESLERALVDDPDELANHMAYADYLGEQGDPLGEFVRVQLALEDPSKPAAERKKLQQQERKLLRDHGKEWLGDLAPFLFEQKTGEQREGNAPRVKYTFRRGWLDTLKAEPYTVNFCRALARSPAVRLLRELAMAYDAYEEAGKDYEVGDDILSDTYCPQLHPLLRCPYLGNVRTFILGEVPTRQEEADADDEGMVCSTFGEASADLVKLMPKIERLYLFAHEVNGDHLFTLKTLENLRELVVYHSRNYPLAKLAKNPSLGKLTHLRFHPHAIDDKDAYIREPGVRALVNSPHLPALTHLQIRLCDMGDKGMKAIAASGILKRLKVLDLQHGCVTDEGARALAACPDLKHLDLLDLTDNALTKAGINALKATGVKVVAKSQWERGEGGDDDYYLNAGDIE